MIVICLAGEHARSARFIIWDLITIPLEMFNVAELPPHLCRVDFVRNLVWQNQGQNLQQHTLSASPSRFIRVLDIVGVTSLTFWTLDS